MLVDATRVETNFKAGGRISATAGCNQLSGHVTFDGARMTISDLSSTELGCEPSRHEQDRWLAELLAGLFAWRLQGDELTLASRLQ